MRMSNEWKLFIGVVVGAAILLYDASNEWKMLKRFFGL